MPSGANLKWLIIFLSLSINSGRAASLSIKLGLWEVTRTTSETFPQMPQISGLSPDIQKQFDQIQKSRKTAEKKPYIFKQCLTLAEVDKWGNLGTKFGNASCQQTLLVDNETVREARLQCDDPRATTVTSHIEVTDSKILTALTHVENNVGQTIDMSFSGHWLQEDCEPKLQ